MQKILEKKLVVIAMMSVPGPFNGYHEMRYKLSSHWSESVGILEPKGKTDFLIAFLMILFDILLQASVA